MYKNNSQPLALPGPTRGGGHGQVAGKGSQSSLHRESSPIGEKDGAETSSLLGNRDVVSRSTSVDTTAVTVTPSSTSRGTPQTGPGAAELEARMCDGLWDAVEDLRQAKQGLEAQLRATESRATELEAELREARAEQTAADEGGQALAAWAAAARAAEAAAEVEKDVLRHDRASLSSENQVLRQEQKALQEKLDVFYRAMELEKAPGPTQDVAENNSAVAGVVGQIERFHSQLVLESVSLRNEVAKLKKKKWVLKAVLDNGGENEKRAIDEEVAKLRLNGTQRRAAGLRQPLELTPRAGDSSPER